MTISLGVSHRFGGDENPFQAIERMEVVRISSVAGSYRHPKRLKMLDYPEGINLFDRYLWYGTVRRDANVVIRIRNWSHLLPFLSTLSL